MEIYTPTVSKEGVLRWRIRDRKGWGNGKYDICGKKKLQNIRSLNGKFERKYGEVMTDVEYFKQS